MEFQKNLKKTLKILKNTVLWLIIVFSLLMMVFTIISANMFDRNDRSLFGLKFFIVISDSMKATDFSAGDVIITKKIDARELVEGDIITFISQDPENYGEVVTHKIRKVTTDVDGSIAFVTYGTTKNENDKTLATIIIGKYVGNLPKLGYFFNFLKTTPGYIVCILIPFLLLIGSQGLNCISLFRRYRKEQLEEMKAEREKIEKEREENRKMMEEILALKKQLAEKESTSDTANTQNIQE